MAQDLTATLEGRTKGEIFTSFDVDAFEVPHGRDEIWRFTPLKRLRGLHDGSAPANGIATIGVTERPGVTVETVRRGDERLGQGGVPADRVAAQAFSSFNSATIVTVEKDTPVGEPIDIAITGPGEGATAYGHLQVRVGELAEAVVVIDQRGSGTYADNIEFMVGWLDALRRDDREALLATLDPGIVWQGLKEEWVCNGPDEVISVFTMQRDAARELDALELIGAEGHAILHARGVGVLEIELEDGIYNVFAIEEGSITRIDDYAERRRALAAAGLSNG